MQEAKGKKKGIKKASTTAISATLLTAGAAGIVFAYQSGAAFHPSSKKQGLKKNQVVFSKDKKVTGHDKQKEKDNSRFLKKDQKEQSGAQTQNNADYMFQNGAMFSQQQQVQIASNANVQQTNQAANTTDKNNYYQVTTDPSNADITINRPTNDANDVTGPTQTDSDNNSNNNSNTNSNNNNNSNNSDNSTNNDHNNNNDHTNSSDDKNDDNKNDDDKTNKRPSDTAKDPESTKEKPSNSLFPTKPFDDTITPIFDDDENGDNQSVIIMQTDDNVNATLYKGQSIKEKDLFNALDTYVYGKDMFTYAWGDSAYDHFVKILGVSFDGGQTWINEYPVTIPDQLASDQMKIKVGYRLSEKKDWTTRIVDYEPKDSRIFVLSQKITEENTTISDDIVVNKYQQHLDLESKMNLFKLLPEYLGYNRLTSLFPGWTEKGELQPWFYKAQAGRHILEPADSVPLDSKYIVKLKIFWMTNDEKIDPDGNQLIYLQTLTDMNEAIAINWLDGSWTGGNLYDTLSVPKYIQAIAIDSDADMSVNHLEVPDTVLYIQLDDSGMRVNESYKVDENNPNYMSTKEGILLTKDGTEIIGIPYNTKKLKVGEAVKRVRIEEKNQLSEIDLSEKSLEDIQNIDYSKLQNCKMIVKDDILSDYIQQNYKNIFANKGNTVASASDPEEEYTVEKDMIINKHKRMIMLLGEGKEQLNLTGSVNSIAEDALKEAKNTKRIVMPEDGSTVLFEKNSLRGSNVQMIQCYTKEQYDSVAGQIEDAGSSDVVVQLINTSKEGYRYCMQATEDSNEVVLMSVPKNITQFDSVMTTQEGERIPITQIGDEAFAQCKDLQWVTLSESIKKIGTEAFKDCTALEGMLIDSKDEITIGDESLDGCTSLRFIGSNAKKGIMENNYMPDITDSHGSASDPNRYFYVPGNCEGYNKACVSVSSGSEIPLSGYCMKDLGDHTKALYGVDNKDNPWILMRAGTDFTDDIQLPEQTKEIFNYALADTTSPTGKYKINLDNVKAIDGGAFYGSDISGDITFANNVMLLDHAMQKCDNITSVILPGENVYLGDSVFNDCSSLESVKIEKMAKSSAIRIGEFTGCNNLRDITLESTTAEKLGLSGDGSFPFQFNLDWTKQEEAEKLRIHIPDGSQTDYIKGWRYIYSGYVGMYDVSAYDVMRQDIYFRNLNWETWEGPSDDEIDALQKEQLLTAENRIRKMLGMQEVDVPMDLYLYHESTDGFLTLADATTQEKEINLGTVDLEMPEGYYLDYLGTKTFRNAKNLTSLIVPENIIGMEDKVFADMESGTIKVSFESETPLKLMLNEEKEPYKFGLEEDKITIKVPKGCEEEYLRSWIFPMAGYEDASDMMAEVVADLSKDGDLPEIKTVYETMAQKLLPIENRLRKMMGMDEIRTIYEMCYKDDWKLAESGEETKSSEKPEDVTKQQEEQSEQTDTSKDTQDETTKDTQEEEQQENNTQEEKKDQEDTKEDSQKIQIPETTKQLETDAYSSENTDRIELDFESKTPLILQLKEEGKAFSFGKDDDKVKISVPEGYEETYIEQWKYAMAGYKDQESMKKAIKEEQTEETSEEQVDEIISQKLLLGENRLRKMMGMEEQKK